MKECRYITAFPVISHLGEQLLPSGVLLDADTLAKLKTHTIDRRLLPIGFSDRVRKDLEGFLENPPYSIIFRDADVRSYVFFMLATVQIPRCTIEVAEFFREKDFYTYRHMLVVFAMSTYIASLMMPDRDVSMPGIVAIAHDIGKCSVPLELLQKTTPLNALQRDHIRHHTLAGFALMHYYSDTQDTDLGARVARDHHERLDGSGYPMGLRTIDKLIQIVVVSDIYDALISFRPYRSESFDNRSALEELSTKAFKGKISMDIVQALIASNRAQQEHWKDCIISTDVRGIPPKVNYHGVLLANGEPCGIREVGKERGICDAREAREKLG